MEEPIPDELLNLVLFILNLIPVPPLDGSKIFAWAFGHKVDKVLDSISSLAEVVGGLRSLADCVLALEDSQVPTGSADAGSSLQRAIADAAEAMDAVLGAARQLTQRDRRLVANWGIAIDGIQRRIGDSVHPWADARDAHDDHGAAVLARLNRMLYELRFAARVERILKAFDADILHRLHHAGAPAKVF